MTDDLLDRALELADEGAYDTADTLRALVERVKEAENGVAEYAPILDRQGELLTGVANALRGDPPPLTTWSHHDLPELAAEARGKLDEWLKVLPAITPAEFPAWRSGYAPKGEVTRVGSELGKARAQLDTVRERVKFHLSGQRNGSGISFILDDVLAILDGNPA